MSSSSRPTTTGSVPVFIPYIMSTSGRAKLNISCDTLSPTQKTAHSTAAMATPATICPGVKRSVVTHARHERVAKVVSTTAETVMVYQKLTRGAVQGENMTNHSTAATTMGPHSLTAIILSDFIAFFMIATPHYQMAATAKPTV